MSSATTAAAASTAAQPAPTAEEICWTPDDGLAVTITSLSRAIAEQTSLPAEVSRIAAMYIADTTLWLSRRDNPDDADVRLIIAGIWSRTKHLSWTVGDSVQRVSATLLHSSNFRFGYYAQTYSGYPTPNSNNRLSAPNLFINRFLRQIPQTLESIFVDFQAVQDSVATDKEQNVSLCADAIMHVIKHNAHIGALTLNDTHLLDARELVHSLPRAMDIHLSSSSDLHFARLCVDLHTKFPSASFNLGFFNSGRGGRISMVPNGAATASVRTDWDMRQSQLLTTLRTHAIYGWRYKHEGVINALNAYLEENEPASQGPAKRTKRSATAAAATTAAAPT